MLQITLVIVSAVISWQLGFVAHGLLKRLNIVDMPNPRSSHIVTMPRGGGIAIVAVILASQIVVGIVSGDRVPILLALLTFVLSCTSLADDIRTLPAKIRFSSHMLASIAIIVIIGWSQYHTLPSGQPAMVVSNLALPIVLLWLAGYTNAFNFMDGINGLAAAQAALCGIQMAVLAALASGDWQSPPILLSFCLGGAALGFLPHNFPRPRMFMGDVSSIPLGFLLAATIFWFGAKYGWWLTIPLGLLHANFILDTGMTLIRRLYAGERWFEAHRGHFYQRLVRSGRTHVFVTTAEIMLQSLVFILMIIYLYVGPMLRIVLLCCAVAVWAVFFIYCDRAFRRALTKQSVRV